MKVTAEDLKNVKWEPCCHFTHANYYLSTRKGIIKGKEIFKDVKTGRNIHGFPTENVKISYCTSLDGDSLNDKELLFELNKDL
jgi:hypothetical protein